MPWYYNWVHDTNQQHVSKQETHMPRIAEKPKTPREAKFYRMGYLAGYGAKRNATTTGKKPGKDKKSRHAPTKVSPNKKVASKKKSVKRSAKPKVAKSKAKKSSKKS